MSEEMIVLTKKYHKLEKFAKELSNDYIEATKVNQELLVRLIDIDSRLCIIESRLNSLFEDEE